MRRAKSFAYALLLFAFLLVGNRLFPATETGPSGSGATDPQLTAQSLRHITTGDSRGGGHLAGMNRPCKSEFPSAWTAEVIAREIPRIAANDNMQWKTSDHGNGYVVADAHTADGLALRIVVNPRKNEIVTAYPTNVRRNPCPANDR